MGAMQRPFNFSPGPAALPEPVLRQAASEMLDWNGTGVSVMEVSHRGKEFMALQAGIEADLRELLAIPANYKVLFLQGGAIGQNAIVPMNLLRGRKSADYVNTGAWATRSIAEAAHFCHVNVAASGERGGFTSIPKQSEWRLDREAAYVHICANETIGGVEYHWVPDTGEVPLVADMSSNILSRPIDVSRYGLIYGGAQKNIGPAGLTFVIVRDDLLGGALPITPEAFNYTIQAANNSMINTPPTFAIYLCRNVLAWVKQVGGLPQLERWNREKGELLYGALDKHAGFYHAPVEKDSRSYMNIVFRLPSEELDTRFVAEAKKAGMVGLKGHRSAGGIRVSAYNAVSVEDIQALVSFMESFAKANG